ncbi:MAG: hypothetical protein QG670_1704 [Thermoproteota archaeon]|nr:hypothetical protein [Thermoproteota archaeon]
MNIFEVTFVLLNGAITVLLGVLILYFIIIKKHERHIFYFAWAFGFIAYGIEILFRNYVGGLFLTIIGTVMYSLLALGAWGLSTRHILAVFPVVVFLGFIWLIGNLPMEVASAFFFGFITIGIMYKRAVFGKDLDKLVFGWSLLLIANIVLWGQWSLDIFAIAAKVILFLGILDEEFALIAEKARVKAQVYPPITAGAKKEGGITLAIPTLELSNGKEVRWMEAKVQEDVKQGIDTYIFAFQDVPSHNDLRKIKWIDPEKVFIFLFSSSAKISKEEFTVFRMDITEIGATLSGVVKNYFPSNNGCVIILTDISLLIHSFNTNDVFSMLLEKMGSLREAGVTIYMFLHPEAHNDPSIYALFRGISDSVIKL